MSSSLSSPFSRIPLGQVLSSVPDPRDRRGIRHPLPVVLACAVAAVAAGARTWVAVAEWATEVDPQALSRLGIAEAAGLPCESTIRRTLAAVDADDLDARLGAWLSTRTGLVCGKRVIAVDGKSLRGAARCGVMPHLVAAFDHAQGVVLAQRAVPAEGSEIPALLDLLAGLDITDAVITADALHCQRATATWITDRGGHYVLTVKANQPTLLRALKALPWAQVPAQTYLQSGHGRRVRRTIKAIEVPTWVDFPAAAQVVQLRRTATVKGRRRVEVVYAISSVPMAAAEPRTIAAWIQGHWQVENALHWVRDVTFNEDKHQLRAGAGPQVMATLRNTVISLLRLAGWTNIAAALRHHARDIHRPINLLTTQ